MEKPTVSFIGLGNVGSKLCGTLLRNNFDISVIDLDPILVAQFVESGAQVATSPQDLTAKVDTIITCLPSPSACAQVMEGPEGVIQGLQNDGGSGKTWLEMSTTDEAEVR